MKKVLSILFAVLFVASLTAMSASARPGWYVVEIGAGVEAGVTALAGAGTGLTLVSMFLMVQDPGLCLALPQQPVFPTCVRYLPVPLTTIFSPLSSLNSVK